MFQLPESEGGEGLGGGGCATLTMERDEKDDSICLDWLKGSLCHHDLAVNVAPLHFPRANAWAFATFCRQYPYVPGPCTPFPSWNSWEKRRRKSPRHREIEWVGMTRIGARAICILRWNTHSLGMHRKCAPAPRCLWSTRVLDRYYPEKGERNMSFSIGRDTSRGRWGLPDTKVIAQRRKQVRWAARPGQAWLRQNLVSSVRPARHNHLRVEEGRTRTAGVHKQQNPRTRWQGKKATKDPS